MRFLFILPFFLSFLFSNEVEKLFQEKKYDYLCKHRWTYINKYKNIDENSLSIVGKACLKKRFIIPALDIAKSMTKTKLGRQNATYIATLFLMEKILTQILHRDIAPYGLNLPYVLDNDLGIVFNEITHGNYKWIDNMLMFYKDGIEYRIRLNPLDNLVISKNGKEETYW